MIDQLSLEQLTLTVTEEIRVRASLEMTFATLLEEMGPHNETPTGETLAGVVQAIKRPTLLEISGPLFLSAPVMSNMQYRLTAVDGGTLISFRHSALGFVPDEVRKDLGTGWSKLHDRVRRVAEQKK